jgi:hypothetical protein
MNNSNNKSSGFPVWAIGVLVGGIALLLIIFIGFFLFIQFRRRRMENGHSSSTELTSQKEREFNLGNYSPSKDIQESGTEGKNYSVLPAKDKAVEKTVENTGYGESNRMEINYSEIQFEKEIGSGVNSSFISHSFLLLMKHFSITHLHFRALELCLKECGGKLQVF